MTRARNAADAVARHVTLEVGSLDRVCLNVYQPQLQTSGGIAVFFRSHRRERMAFSALTAPMTRAFATAAERFEREEGVDLVTFRKGERKNNRTQQNLRRWCGG